MGGDCLNTGCVPSKALIRSALARHAKKAHDSAWPRRRASRLRRGDGARARVIARRRAARLGGALHRPGRGGARRAMRASSRPWTVEVTLADGRRADADDQGHRHRHRRRPFVPPHPRARGGRLSSPATRSVGLRELPGAGGAGRRPDRLRAGAELSRGWAAQVTQVEMAPRIMVREDPEVSELVAAALRADGVNVLTGHQAVRFEVGRREILVADTRAREVRHPFDQLLCAVGRSSRAGRLRPGGTGHSATPRKTIETNAYLQTLPQHLRRRRRGRAVPVHPHRRAPGLVRRGQRAVRRFRSSRPTTR
jgi:hypothetical protein